MSKYNPNNFGSLSIHSRLLTLFRLQTDLIEELLNLPLPESCKHIAPLLGAIHGSGKTILLLEKEKLTNELHLIQRIFVQIIINCCYLLNAEHSVIKNYLSTPTATKKNQYNGKSVDDLVEHSKSYDPETPASPFSLSLREQAEEIFQKTGVPKELFLISIVGSHQKSTEILSGSLFGTAFQFGIFKNNTVESEKKSNFSLDNYEELTTTFLTDIILIGAMLKCISKRETIESIQNKSATNVKEAENIIQGSKNGSLQKFTEVDGSWEILGGLESGATSIILKQLHEFIAPMQEAYEAGVIAPMLKPVSQPSLDLRCAALLLKRSLNDFRGVWILLIKGYTSQAASIAASLYESTLATICLTLSKQNIDTYLAEPSGEIPWSPMDMSKMVVRGTNKDNKPLSKEFENQWRALYAQYVWLCQIKHSAHASVIHDTTATMLDTNQYGVIALPNTDISDANVKASILIKSILNITDCTAAFAKALGYTDSIPDNYRFAERIKFAQEEGWKAFQPFLKPSPISISNTWFVKKYPPMK